MHLDIEKYLPYLDHYQWSQQEKIEMLHALWRMMGAQADKAFGGSPLQVSCAKDARDSLPSSPDSVNSNSPPVKRSTPMAANDNTYDQPKGQRHAG